MCEKKKTHTKNVNIYRDYHILYNVIILYEVSYILRTNRILYINKRIFYIQVRVCMIHIANI